MSYVVGGLASNPHSWMLETLYNQSDQNPYKTNHVILLDKPTNS